jgi:hypothetical protein
MREANVILLSYYLYQPQAAKISGISRQAFHGDLKKIVMSKDWGDITGKNLVNVISLFINKTLEAKNDTDLRLYATNRLFDLQVSLFQYTRTMPSLDEFFAFLAHDGYFSPDMCNEIVEKYYSMIELDEDYFDEYPMSIIGNVIRELLPKK